MAYVKSLHGSTGSITIPAGMTGLVVGTNIHIKEWHATAAADLIDDTDFSDTSNWTKVARGAHDLKGTAVGTLMAESATPLGDFSTANAAPVAGMVLTLASGRTYTFPAILGNIRTRVPKVGVVEINLSFESSGAIVVA